jgi:precorrin-2/cobalt-factor-2 C20-methyltransferase
MTMGRVICAGLGPGDPDLMSLRAARTIGTAKHVAYFRKAGRAGQAGNAAGYGRAAAGCGGDAPHDGEDRGLADLRKTEKA